MPTRVTRINGSVGAVVLRLPEHRGRGATDPGRCSPTAPAVRHLIQANGIDVLGVLTLPVVLLAGVGWSPAAPAGVASWPL